MSCLFPDSSRRVTGKVIVANKTELIDIDTGAVNIEQSVNIQDR